MLRRARTPPTPFLARVTARLGVRVVGASAEGPAPEDDGEPGGFLLLTDLLGGTPHRVATLLREDLPDPAACAVVSGVNLAMVVDALAWTLAERGEALLAAAKEARRLIALTAGGKQMDSPGLADFLRKQIEVYGSLAFLIGGPVGLSPDVLAACDDALSLSLLTFPHELARVILLEQLYRAATIIGGEKYHK